MPERAESRYAMKARETLWNLGIEIERSDAWGSVLGAHFDIAHAIEHYGREYPPADWGYRDALGCDGLDRHASGENDQARTIAAAILRHPELERELVRVGNVLQRYSNMLKRAGRSY